MAALIAFLRGSPLCVFGKNRSMCLILYREGTGVAATILVVQHVYFEAIQEALGPWLFIGFCVGVGLTIGTLMWGVKRVA